MAYVTDEECKNLRSVCPVGAIVELVQDIRAALVANGILATPA